MTFDPELALLQSLADSAPYLVPERSLFAEVNNRLLQTMQRPDFSELLNRTKSRRRVDLVDGEDGRKWRITDDGFARLNEMRRAQA